MRTNIRKKAKAIAWLLTLVYFASYLTRKNFHVMISAVASEMVSSGAFSNLDVANTTLAIVSGALTVVYGIGQIVNGIFGDKIKPQLMLTVGLALASVSNVAMYLCPDNYIAMAIIWGINGFAQSMLWPPIVRLMATHLNDDEYGYSSVRVSWGSSIATIVLYFGCGALISVISWREVLLICAGCGVIILAVWVILNGKLFATGEIHEDIKKDDEKKKFPLPLFVFIPITLIMFGIILQGSLRDGVEIWTPTILQGENEALGGSVAIILTVVPAIFSMISFSAFDLLHRKFFKNEVVCAGVIFLGATVFALGVFLTNLFVQDASVATVLYLIFISLLTGCMHGINLMLITVAPKRFLKSGKISTFSGILNACTYVGSAVGVWIFAQISVSGSWGDSMMTWVIISAIGCAVCFAAVPLWEKFCRIYSDN